MGTQVAWVYKWMFSFNLEMGCNLVAIIPFLTMKYHKRGHLLVFDLYISKWSKINGQDIITINLRQRFHEYQAFFG